MVYGNVHAKSIGDMVDLRFTFERLVELKQKEDLAAGKPATEAASKLSAIQFKLDT